MDIVQRTRKADFPVILVLFGSRWRLSSVPDAAGGDNANLEPAIKKGCFGLANEKRRCLVVLPRTRTWNPLLRRQMPYPLGQQDLSILALVPAELQPGVEPGTNSLRGWCSATELLKRATEERVEAVRS